VGDAGVAALAAARLPRLACLNVAGTQVSEVGARTLHALPALTALNLTDAAIGPALAETMAVVLIHNAAGMCEPSRPYFLGCPPTRGTVGLPSPRLASPAGNKLSLGAPRLS
jgi:hypothetical protein